MKWARCNHCYCKLDTAQEPFHLTKCGHLFCARCITQAERQCPVCNAVNVPKVCLQEPLEPVVRLYFTPLKDSMQQLLEVSNFQDAQLRITMKKLAQTEAKYTYCKDICHKLEVSAAKIHKKYSHDIEECRKLIRHLKDENAKLKNALSSGNVRNAPIDEYCSSQSSAASSLTLHTCEKRHQRSVPRVSFRTPLSASSEMASNASSNSDRRCLPSLPRSNTIFQIPSIARVPRSAGSRCVPSLASTPASTGPERLKINSLRISRS